MLIIFIMKYCLFYHIKCTFVATDLPDAVPDTTKQLTQGEYVDSTYMHIYNGQLTAQSA